ncbi:MAG TPA: TonB-dependent receptor [Sphingomicrobium sp.]|nr:TonB-dependent receptor [Sphingomicrobium sp.]
MLFSNRYLLSAVSIVALAQGTITFAQDPPPAPAEQARADSASGEEDDLQSAQEIVVLGQIGYRNRSDATEPVLVYDTEYFQRFEPLTIGDALKRVPSVTFLSDVIESDGARVRGLDPGYTQILINGEKVPGSNFDRSFFLDRIPAELVDRVEIVRSNSARRSADAVAGTLNIVLRDAFALDGGYIKGGGIHFDDGKVKPVTGLVWGGRVGPGRVLIGGTIQGRHNPKKKQSFRYGDSPENDPDFETNEFDNREDQDDTRDGTDYSANGSYAVEFGGTKLDFAGFYVRTDRSEIERSLEYDDPAARTGPVGGLVDGNLLTDASQFEEIDQENYVVSGKVKQRWSGGETGFKAAFARFDEDISATELEIDFDTDEDPPEIEGTQDRQKLRDSEFSLQLDHSLEFSPGIKVVVGAFYQDKDRDTDIRAAENDAELTEADRNAYDQFTSSPGDFPISLDEFEPVAGGLNRIEERRRDLFALLEGTTGNVSWEAGVRYEDTRVSIDDLEADERFENDYAFFMPSASVKVQLTRADRITASVARTNRRPNFDFISPALLEEEFGDHDLRGNPELRPETAWGIDVGYERRIGRTGVAGVNVFYRKLKDLVELVNTGELGSNDESIFEPRNTGDGNAWGIEFDLSTSLQFLGLPDTGVFGNYSWLDSKIRDFAGNRRFNGQPKYVYNFGFIQDFPGLAASFGATYRKQGSALDRFVTEEVRTTYGADLELFVEKRLWNRLTIRAVGSNLLNGAKKEVFNKFDTVEDQLDRDFDEFELESEKAGPVFQLVGRLAF